MNSEPSTPDLIHSGSGDGLKVYMTAYGATDKIAVIDEL